MGIAQLPMGRGRAPVSGLGNPPFAQPDIQKLRNQRGGSPMSTGPLLVGAVWITQSEGQGSNIATVRCRASNPAGDTHLGQGQRLGRGPGQMPL